MRDDLNAILSFIGAESLTDGEFNSIELENLDDQVLVYNALLIVLQSRDDVSSTMAFRLQNYYLAQGIEVVPVSVTPIRDSNIFVGAPLEDLDDDN